MKPRQPLEREEGANPVSYTHLDVYKRQDQVRSAVTQAADHFGVSLSDSDVDSLVSVVRKVLDAKIDEDALRSDVNSVYSKLQDMGVTKDDAKMCIRDRNM